MSHYFGYELVLSRLISLISSCVIEKILEQPWLDSKDALAYFYCSRTSSDTRQQDPRAILLSILRQLAAPLPGLPIKPPVISVYDRETTRGSQEAQLSIDEIAVLLAELIHNHYENVTIVLDALDEGDVKGRLYLLDTFTKLTYNPKTAVKTLVSSRNDPDIENHFSKIPNLFITVTDNAGDIMRFITKELGQRLLRGKASTQIRARVEDDLNKKANGVFRWVALQVDALCDPDRVYTEEDVEYLLPRLPKTLEDTYAVILHSLDNLPPPSREAIRNVLKLLICAEYPMSIHELLEALAILSEPRQAAWERSQILKMAKGLIITKESKKDLFVFSHLSVREFLEKRVEFSGENAHVVAAEACLKAYIRSNCSSIRCNNFRSYALTYLGRHCKKSGTLRQEPRLRSLLERFLAEDSNDAFERWNRDCFHTYGETAPGTCAERRVCQSLPCTPLFMVCFYGFVEFVKPTIRGKDRVLYAENIFKERPLEVAARNQNYDVMELVYHAASSTDPSSIRAEEWLVAAAQSCNLDIWNFAVEHVPYVSFDRLLAEAANTPVHGKEMVSSLLNNITNIKHEVLEIVFHRCASFEILDIILAHSPSFKFTESILVAAAQNLFINPELTEMVLSDGQDLRVSEDCILSAIYLSRFTVPSITAVFKALLNHPNRCKISEEMICKMARTVSSEGIEGLDLLIQHCSTDCITDDMLAAAVENSNTRPFVLEFFLSHALGHTITQQVLQEAITNRSDTYSRVTTLLSRAECPPVLEESLYIMTETWPHEISLLPTVMERCEALYIGNFYLQACAANRSSQEVEHVTSLPRAISISKDTVRASLKNSIDAKCMLDLLLHLKFGFELEKSEDLLCEALSIYCNELDLVRVLAKHWDSLPITERSMMVAVKNSPGINTANYLLQHCKSVGEMLTENVLQAAIDGDNVEFVMFFKQRRPHFHVKEEYLLAAISEYSNNNAMLRILLSQQDRCPISKLVLETAAEKGTSSTLELLLQEPGVSSLLPETLNLANGNASSVDIDKETTFEAILSTASSKEAMLDIHWSELSTKKLDLLLSKYNDPILDSSRLIEAAAERGDGKFVVQYLLSRFPEALITRRALLAAASNEVAMTSLFSLLLEHTHICIDSELLALAAGNKYRGTQMVELLLANWSADKKIERSAIIAALRNPYCGRSLFNLFLSKQPDFTIAQDVVDAASENEVLGKSILQMLLKQALTLSSMTLADLVFNKMKIIPDGLRDSLFIAVCYQENIILRFLISRGVSISTVSGELGTALNVAVYASNVNAVETLLDNGSDPNFCSKLYGTPLQSACQQRNLDIVRSLINHGAEIDLPNQMGRTDLHRMLREGHYDVVNALISFGASTVIKDVQGMAAMHHACLCTNSADCINRLIELGSPVNQEDYQQWTPLHWAARSGAADTVIRLLEAGAEKTKTDVSGKTPFQVAILFGNIHLRSKLVLTDASDLDLELPGEEHPGYYCNACELVSLSRTSSLKSANAIMFCCRVFQVHDTNAPNVMILIFVSAALQTSKAYMIPNILLSI